MGKKKLGTGFVVTAVAVAMALASTAYACTAWRGTMTVETASGSTAASNDTGMMVWCSSPATVSGSGASVADSSGQTVKVQMAPTTADGVNCDAGWKLPQDTYDIRWAKGIWDPFNQTGTDCMGTTLLNNNAVSVDANGNSSQVTSAGFDPDGATQVSICIVNDSQFWGNQVHISVL